jgi:hypothetical protein
VEIPVPFNIKITDKVGFWCLTPHSTIFQLYRGGQYWKTVIYIYVCGKCRTQFMLPMEKSVTFTGACANEIIPSINRSFVYKAKEGGYVRICDKVCQWFSPGTLVSSTNKTDCHIITEISLKMELNTINQTIKLF